MPRKVVCLCGQALLVPDQYDKPAARCSACGARVDIPPAKPGAIDLTPVSNPMAHPGSPYGANSQYGDPMAGLKSSPPQPTYGLPPPPSNPGNSLVLWIVLAVGGLATLLFCGCGGLLFFSIKSKPVAVERRFPQPPMPNMPIPPQPPTIPGMPPDFPRPANVPPGMPAFSSPNAAPEIVWKRHLSRASRLEVDLPGIPTEVETTVGPEGEAINRISCVLRGRGEFFVYAYQRSREEQERVGGTNGALQKEQDNIVARVKGNGAQSYDATLPLGAAREIKTTSVDGTTVYWGRIALQQHQLFEVGWIGPPDKLPHGEIQRVFHSLQVRGDLPPPILTASKPVVPPILVPAPLPPSPPPFSPPPFIPPPVTPPPSRPIAAKTAAEMDLPQKRNIYLPIKIHRTHLELLQKMHADFQSKNLNVQSLKGQLERGAEELDRRKNEAAERHGIERAELDKIIAEGDERKW